MSPVDFNVRHLTPSDPEPKPDPNRVTIFNMRFCPFGQRALLAALAKGIDFDLINVNMYMKPEWYFQWNPNGQVPAIQVRDKFRTYESLVIADYIDEAFEGPKLGPSSPEEKANDTLLVKNIETVLALWGKADDERKAKVFKALDQFEDVLSKGGHKFIRGSEAKMIDYKIWPIFERIPAYTTKITLENYPKINAWIAAMSETPAVSAFRVTDADHETFMKSYHDGTKNVDLLLGKK